MKNSVLVIVSMALAPCWALAQNGVVLINQATVAATGVNRPTNGFPYVITQPGSYQLSGNLTVPASVNGIQISASFVSLDLNGFDISCVGNCSGKGVTDNFTPQSGITIRNGAVFGFSSGIALFSNGSFIEKVTAQSNEFDGIDVGDSSTIKDCIALNNGGDGIIATSHGIVSGSVASGNGGVGISVHSGTLTGNTADSNGSVGINSSGSSTLTGNTANNNGYVGFYVAEFSTLTGNTASANNTGFFVFCPANLVGNTADTPLAQSGAGCNKINNLGF